MVTPSKGILILEKDDPDGFFEMSKVGVRSIQQGTSPAIIESLLYAIIDKQPDENAAA